MTRKLLLDFVSTPANLSQILYLEGPITNYDVKMLVAIPLLLTFDLLVQSL